MASTVLDRVKRALAPLFHPVLVYDASPPTIEDGDVRPAQMGAGGGLLVEVVGGGGTSEVSQGAAGADPWRVRSAPRVARAVHAASATLPAAGAFTSPTAYAVPDGARAVNFYVTYARGAVGGYPLFRFTAGNGTETAASASVDSSAQVSAPYGRRAVLLDELAGPAPASADPITFVLPWRVSGGETHVALRAAEGGQPDTPGTCAVSLTAQYT
jgi:hypothetical protein